MGINYPKNRRPPTGVVWWSSIEVTGFCWLWTGVLGSDGYALHQAHRKVWEHLVGLIPEGLELDHLCRIKRCVNPDHLEPVTRLENIRRRYALVTTCKNGHPFDEANTYVRPTGHRDCRACMRVRTARAKRKRQLVAALASQ